MMLIDRWTRSAARRVLVVVAILCSITVTGAPDAAAQSSEPVIEFEVVIRPARPVTHSPVTVSFSIVNRGLTPATGIHIEATLPSEATVVRADGGRACTVTNRQIACDLAELAANASTAYGFMLEFVSDGTFGVTSTLTSTDPVETAASAADIVIEPENADLRGRSERIGSLTGERQRVFHLFQNHGPTASGLATIAGDFPVGVAMVPGTFFFGRGTNSADQNCNVTSMSYTCTPVTDECCDGFTEAIAYDAVMPSSPTTVVATATIVGRNDPDPTNNTSTYTVDVRRPAAELLTDFPSPPPLVFSGQPFTLTGRVQNIGEIAAQNVVTSLSIPADWTIDFESATPAPAVSCAELPSGIEIRCELGSLQPFAGPLLVSARLTPPANSTGEGTVTMAASTDTRELGSHPNSESIQIPYQPFMAPSVTVTPSSALTDGQTVRVDVTGFLTSDLSGVVMCEPNPASGEQCDLTTVQPFAPAPNGTASLNYDVRRVIVTPAGGRRDCAVDPCTVTAGTITETLTASAAVTFTNTPLPPAPFQVDLLDDHFISSIGPPGSTTVRASLHCDTALNNLELTFELEQQTPSAVSGSSTLVVSCAAGQTQVVPSDLMPGFSPGAATATVGISNRLGEVSDSGPVAIHGSVEIEALVQAALNGPDGAAVRQRLIDAIRSRMANSPIFRQAFIDAIRAAQP